jgi:hypothetical protein
VCLLAQEVHQQQRLTVMQTVVHEHSCGVCMSSLTGCVGGECLSALLACRRLPVPRKSLQEACACTDLAVPVSLAMQRLTTTPPAGTEQSSTCMLLLLSGVPGYPMLCVLYVCKDELTQIDPCKFVLTHVQDA